MLYHHWAEDVTRNRHARWNIVNWVERNCIFQLAQSMDQSALRATLQPTHWITNRWPFFWCHLVLILTLSSEKGHWSITHITREMSKGKFKWSTNHHTLMFSIEGMQWSVFETIFDYHTLGTCMWSRSLSLVSLMCIYKDSIHTIKQRILCE